MASLIQWTWTWVNSRRWWAWRAAVHGVAKSQTWLGDWMIALGQCIEWSGNLIQLQSESVDGGWSLRVCLSNQFPGDANTRPASTLGVANFLALRIQQQRIQRPLPWGESSWARSVLDLNKGGEVEVRGTQSLRQSAGRECRGCLTKLPHFRDCKTEAHHREGS